MLSPQVAGYMPLVITHIAAGGTAIVSGYAAVAVRKGERLHRAFGNAFALAMLIMAGMAVYLAIVFQGVLPGQIGNIVGGSLAIYLVITGWIAAKQRDAVIGASERWAFAAVVLLFGASLSLSIKAAQLGKFDGYRPVFYFVFTGVIAFLAAADLSVILRGGLSGVQRIARHLWRMSFAFFFAAGSFFFGQQKVMPQSMHGAWYLTVLGLAPLAVMIFWLIRIRFGRRFKSSSTPVTA
jgi:uncharacterized membrane protein